jgi:hypothetical protein
LLDTPQRPAQPPQPQNLLFLFFTQDVDHPGGWTTLHPPPSTSRPPTRNGRFSGVHQWPVLGVHRGCGAPFFICASCDRGHRYCGSECRRAARVLSLRRARQVYDRSEPARLDRRDRQRRYRRRKTVTDQSSQARQSICTLRSPEVRHVDRRVTTRARPCCLICGRVDTHVEPWTERIPGWSDVRWS